MNGRVMNMVCCEWVCYELVCYECGMLWMGLLWSGLLRTWSVLKGNRPILKSGNSVILTCFFIIYLRNAAKKWSASTLILVKLLAGSPVLNSKTM